MARRGKGGNRKQRLEILGLHFQDLYNAHKDYPTVTELARKFGVTTPTIYHDLEKLRDKMGTVIVPIGLPLGSKKRRKV